MKRRWILASWTSIAVAALAAVLMLQHDPGRARAATQYSGPKEAEVTIEDGNVKTVHLTSSKFLWQFRDDQPPVEVWGYNNQIPGPTLHFRAGDVVRIYYQNNLDEASSVHWHGLVVPNSMDGVAPLTQPPVMPGETFVYQFTMPDTPGTFMYHAHMDDMTQIGMGLYGGIIIDPKDGGDGKYTQDHLLVLSDIKGHYLINGKEFPNTDPILVKTGDLLRVRMVNISSVESHPMHFHGHFTRVIAQDGTDVANAAEARVENTVLVAPGQTTDVEVKMNSPSKGVWIWHCHVLAHVMGPDPTSLKLAEANGGMIIPVVYTDSLNFSDLNKALTDAIASIQPASGTSGAGDAVASAQAAAGDTSGHVH